MQTVNAEPIIEIINRQAIDAGDLLKLEREVFDQGITSHDEAEVVLHLHEICDISAPQWNTFFTTSLSEYFVDREEPKGEISTLEANALIERFARNGKLDSTVDFELLLTMVERANHCTDDFIIFLLDQVKQSAQSGEGLLRAIAPTSPPSLVKSEIDMIKRILFPISATRQAKLTHRRAAFLMDLNDQLDEEKNHESWSEFYAKSVSGYIIQCTANLRKNSSEKENWLKKPSLINRLSGKDKATDKKHSSPEYMVDSLNTTPNGKAQTDGIANRQPDETIDPIVWFVTRMGAYETLSDNNAKVLKRLKKHPKKLHSSIVKLIKNAKV